MSNLKIMHLISLILILGFYSSCKNQKQHIEELVISLEKTPCFGPCEAYKLEIFTSGLIKFNGVSNHKMMGKHTSFIKPEELQQIVRQFRDKNFFDFKDQYTSSLKDLPTTYLYFRDQSREKTIQDYDNTPQQVKELERVVEDLIPTLKWKKID